LISLRWLERNSASMLVMSPSIFSGVMGRFAQAMSNPRMSFSRLKTSEEPSALMTRMGFSASRS